MFPVVSLTSTVTTETPLQIWEKPWHDPQENDRWFGRFRYYLELGPERSLDSAWRNWKSKQPQDVQQKIKGVRPPKTWREAKENYQWVERCKAYDQWMSEQKLQIHRKLEQEELKLWEERSRELRKRKWELSEELDKLCRKGFKFPLSTQVISDDGQSVIVTPSKWSLRDMIAAASTSADLGDRAVGKPDVDLITAIEVVIAEKIFPDDVNVKLLDALDSGFEEWRDRIRSALDKQENSNSQGDL